MALPVNLDGFKVINASPTPSSGIVVLLPVILNRIDPAEQSGFKNSSVVVPVTCEVSVPSALTRCGSAFTNRCAGSPARPSIIRYAGSHISPLVTFASTTLPPAREERWIVAVIVPFASVVLDRGDIDAP